MNVIDTQIADAAIGKSAMRKALWHILPLIALAYLFAFMDRVNVSFAATEMNADLKFSATIYGLGGGLFFLGYALFEIPSNLMLVRFGARKWIARIMITWGLLSASMLFIQTTIQFYVLRFLLGVAEAGFFPGVIYYFSGWFPACHRSRAVSRFYVATPLSAVVMGGLSGWLLSLDGLGGLHGWQWLFLVQGLPTVLVGLIILRFLPDAPASVPWLRGVEKEWIHRELQREQLRIGEPPTRHVLSVLRNSRVLLLGAIGFPVIASSTNLDGYGVGYLVSLGGVVGAGAMLWAGNHADVRGDRFLNAFWFSILLAFAFLVIGISPRPEFTIAAYLAFTAACFTVPMLTASGWAEILSVRELAVGAAGINTMANSGAFVLPFAWGVARDATGGYRFGLGALLMLTLALGTLILLLRSKVRRTYVAAAALS